MSADYITHRMATAADKKDTIVIDTALLCTCDITALPMTLQELCVHDVIAFDDCLLPPLVGCCYSN